MKDLQIITVILLLFSFGINAQTDLPTGKIEVIKDYEVRLVDANKIRIIPPPRVIDSTGRHYEYQLLAVSPTIEYEVAELKPLAIEPEVKPAYYPLFAKAGYGNPNSILGLLSYDRLMNNGLAWGVDLRHLSANNKKIELQRFADTQGRINMSKELGSSFQVDGYVDGRYETVYFYGADEIPANPDALRRDFVRYDINIGGSNVRAEKSSLMYDFYFRYLNDKDDLGTKENSIIANGDIHFLLGANEMPAGIKLTADFTKMQDVSEQTINNYLLEPYIKYTSGDLKLSLGGIALLNPDENELLPALELSYNIHPLISVHLGWQGEVVKNNFHHLSTYNPYIISRLDSINNMVSRKIFAGINGITGIFNYAISANYTRFENMPFFLQDFNDHEQFKPFFDNGSFIGIEGAVSFGFLKHVKFRGNAFTRFYTLKEEEKPWHRPTFGVDAITTYAGGMDTYHVSVLFHGESGLPYRTVGGTVSKLEPLLDINLHGDYYFMQSLGAFVELNNLLGNNRERWAGYPSYGFNVKGGLMLRI